MGSPNLINGPSSMLLPEKSSLRISFITRKSVITSTSFFIGFGNTFEVERYCIDHGVGAQPDRRTGCRTSKAIVWLFGVVLVARDWRRWSLKVMHECWLWRSI